MLIVNTGNFSFSVDNLLELEDVRSSSYKIVMKSIHINKQARHTHDVEFNDIDEMTRFKEWAEKIINDHEQIVVFGLVGCVTNA